MATKKSSLLAQVKINGISMPVTDALMQLNALPNSTSLAASEAAIFLRISEASLERMRKSGIGPAWLAVPGAKGASSATYLKQDLIAWMAANKAGGPVVVAKTAPPPGVANPKKP